MKSNYQNVFVDVYEPVFTIGITAKKVGVSPETLRLYEREGLLVTHRTKTGRRLYSQQDLEWIACIRRQIRENHLNLAAIRRLLALVPCWELKPCGVEDRNDCPAYTTNDQVCWNLKNTLEQCVNDDCRTCQVYLEAVKVGHLKERYELSIKN